MYRNFEKAWDKLTLENNLKDDWEKIDLQSLPNSQKKDENVMVDIVKPSELPKDQSPLKSEKDCLNSQISALSLEVDSLKVALKEMQKQVHALEWNRHEVCYTFKISNAKAFIESSEVRRCGVFYCRGIGWHLTASATRVNGQPESLSIDLNHNHTATNWFIETSFSISILNETSGQKNKTKKLVHGVFSEKTRKRGFRKFTAIEKLKNRGFLKNDQLSIQIYLHANKMCKLSPF